MSLFHLTVDTPDQSLEFDSKAFIDFPSSGTHPKLSAGKCMFETHRSAVHIFDLGLASHLFGGFNRLKREKESWRDGRSVKKTEIKNIEKCGGASWIFHQRIIFCREDVRSPLVRAILRILSFRRTFSVELDLDELIWPRHLRELQKLDNSLVTLLSMWGFTRNYQILQAHYKDRLDQYSNIDY